MRITRKSWPSSNRSPAPFGLPEILCFAANISLAAMFIAGVVNAAAADYRWV